MYQKCATAGVCAEVSEDALSYFGDLGDLSDYPVTDIDWFEADTYCRWAGRSLPTEAQWEKAARGIDGQSYPWGEEKPAGNLANFADVNAIIGDWVDESVDDGYRDIAPVGSYPDGASPYGALDMAGNVSEWVSDWEGTYPDGNVHNPHGPSSGEYRVFRGGSWFEEADSLRAAYRSGSFPIYGFSESGFRCVLNEGFPGQ